MKNKILRSLLILIMIVSILTSQTTFVSAEEETPGRVVRVACGMNDALYLDQDGNPAGIFLPYLRQLAWNNNWTLEYVQGSYSESMEKLYDGTIDMMFPIGKEEDPDGKLAFSEFIGGYQQIGLFAKEDSEIYYEDYAAFDNKKVGLSIGGNSDILDIYAEEHQFSYTPVSLNSTQDKIDALINNEVDLICFSTLNTVPGGKLVAVLDQLPFYLCTLADNTELMAEINKGMSEQMVNTPDIVTDMYQSVLKGYNAISYTKAENEKIKNTDKITFGVYKDCLPLAGIDSDGNCVGIYVDILKEVQANTGIKIEIVPVEDSNRLYSYLDDGTVDFVIGEVELRFYQENADNHLASNSMADYTTVAVSLPNYQFEKDDVPTIALTKARNYLESYIYSEFPSAEIKYYDTRKECLNAVQNGKADATFINTWEYNYESKNPRFHDMLEWESIRMSSGVVFGATRQSDLEILSIFEKAISQMSQEKVSDIVASNLNMPYDSYDFADRFYEVRTELTVCIVIFVVLFICIGIYLNVKRRYIKDLVIANKTKSDFLSRMSHELRTPLNAINGYAAITTENAEHGNIEKEELIGNMNTIQKASKYLLGIIKDILDVQQMETGKIVLEKSEINPVEYMKTVMDLIHPMAAEKTLN